MGANRILIVDDEPEIGRLIANAADACGYTAFATTDVEEFRERSRSWDPSHIVLDLAMPATDGVELLRFLAAEKSTARILIASGFDPKVIDSARQLGIERGLSIVGSFQKPIRIKSLQALLTDLRDDPFQIDEDSIAAAIAGDQLSLAFQPKVSFTSRRNPDKLWDTVLGFESLVRWNHPERGTIPPSEFIPVAETLGLMEGLTERVFALALAQMRRWRDEGLVFSVSVNMSAENLYDVDVVDKLARSCRDAGVPADQIVIELTETAAMRDIAQAMDITTRLRIKGFKLSMDDFGTGYSSLVQLQRMPFSELKIDQAFTKQCVESSQSRMIVKTMIDMAHNLGMVAVAEGVENAEIARLLIEMGCDIGQGYGLGRPMPADQVTSWIKENTTPI